EATFVVAEFSREFEQTFVRFAAAVAEENFSRADGVHELFRETALRFVKIKVRGVNEFSRLLDERFGDCGMRVAERRHRDAAAEIEITLSGDVVNETARTMAEHDFKSRVARNDVFVEETFDGGNFVANDCGRRRN